MAELTITEALAEIPTILKRIAKKQDFIRDYLYRQANVRDPHEKNGGSALLIEQEMQGIKDLQQRLINIRAAIQKANQENTITINGMTRSIADWLTWRRELADNTRMFYTAIRNSLTHMRSTAMSRGLSVVDKDAGPSPDFVVNINEKKFAEEAEYLEEVLGVLDGQLSLKNATIMIDVP